jgi:hypothetical protein
MANGRTFNLLFGLKLLLLMLRPLGLTNDALGYAFAAFISQLYQKNQLALND